MKTCEAMAAEMAKSIVISNHPNRGIRVTAWANVSADNNVLD